MTWASDLERWSYNTAVAHCMELLEPLQRYAARTPAPTKTVWNEALDALLRLLAPLTPHVTAEIWEHRQPGEPSVHLQRWPTFDPELMRQDTVTMVVQVNGKVRDRVEVDAGISEADAEAAALASAKVARRLTAGPPAGGGHAAAPGQRRRSENRRANRPAHGSPRTALVEPGQHALPHLGVDLVGGVEAEAVDHVAEAAAHLAGHLVERRHDGEGVEDSSSMSSPIFTHSPRLDRVLSSVCRSPQPWSSRTGR